MPSSIGGVGGPGGIYTDMNQPDESHVVVPGEVATISLDAGDHRSQRWKVLNKPDGLEIREHMERDPNMPSGPARKALPLPPRPALLVLRHGPDLVEILRETEHPAGSEG